MIIVMQHERNPPKYLLLYYCIYLKVCQSNGQSTKKILENHPLQAQILGLLSLQLP